jgi:NAD(P)-dependent dehydrogenase (short-subunit alcohol dehydrogenase family)
VGRLDDKVAIVTGGCRGIGLGITERFAAEGARVYAVDLERHGAELPAGVEFRGGDVAAAATWEAIVGEVGDAHGRVDVLVNNAGIGSWETVTELDEEGWQRCIDVDQKSVWLGMRAVIPGMIDAGGGAIVNMSSICGVVARPGVFAYHAAKGAVVLMTQNAAVTYAPQKVRVNSIAPGFISTPLTAMQDARISQEFVDDTPLGHPGEPADIAAGALYLASDEARFVTGINLPIDGGYLAR